jgi:hypothetical protein
MMTLPEPYNRFAETAFFGYLYAVDVCHDARFLRSSEPSPTCNNPWSIESGTRRGEINIPRSIQRKPALFLARVGFVCDLCRCVDGALLCVHDLFYGRFCIHLRVINLLFPMFLVVLPVLAVGYSVLELAQASIIADDMGVFRAISHGWELFRKNWLTVSLLMVILYFGMTMISSTLMFPMMIPMMGFPFLMETQGAVSNLMVGAFFVVFAYDDLGVGCAGHSHGILPIRMGSDISASDAGRRHPDSGIASWKKSALRYAHQQPFGFSAVCIPVNSTIEKSR